jgi:hypothetical protein
VNETDNEDKHPNHSVPAAVVKDIFNQNQNFFPAKNERICFCGSFFPFLTHSQHQLKVKCSFKDKRLVLIDSLRPTFSELENQVQKKFGIHSPFKMIFKRGPTERIWMRSQEDFEFFLMVAVRLNLFIELL